MARLLRRKYIAEWVATRSSWLRILGGRADANVGFDALCALLRQMRFDERTRSSHHMFRGADVEELINLQRDGDKAKVYQVRQVRAILAKYGLTAAEPPEGA